MLNDRALTARVERAIADERTAFADGIANSFPAAKASWLSVAGGRAIFTGTDFFSNRALGMGVTAGVTERDIEQVEAFYTKRGVPPSIEIASTVERRFIDLLVSRRYQMVRFHNVYAQTLPAPAAEQNGVGVVEIHKVSGDVATRVWSTVLLDGFDHSETLDRDRVSRWNQMLSSLPNLRAFVAAVDGRPVGAASVLMIRSTALFGGAATLPAYRCRGVQQALINARLALATRAGCNLAVVTADPGSTSGRNAERTGFQLVNTHVAMRKGE